MLWVRVGLRKEARKLLTIGRGWASEPCLSFVMGVSCNCLGVKVIQLQCSFFFKLLLLQVTPKAYF